MSETLGDLRKRVAELESELETVKAERDEWKAAAEDGLRAMASAAEMQSKLQARVEEMARKLGIKVPGSGERHN